MRVNAVGFQPSANCVVKNSRRESGSSATANITHEPYRESFTNNNEKLHLKGFKIHLLDNGLHADVMTHFANAISNYDMQLYTKFFLHKVDLLPQNKGLKNLKSLKEHLIGLETNSNLKAGDSLVIPVTAPIELNKLAYLYKRETGQPENFTPANIKSKKDVVLNFLSNISEYTLKDIDPEKQGFENIVNIINLVNSFVKKGVKVYIPSDHPLEAAIKWKANELGVKDELYRYISTGYDSSGQIKNIISDLKAKNAYKFNLLTLSDAHIVSLQNRTETGDYIFSAYDSCITDKARGVYNFTPIRNPNGDIKGYSFTDCTTIQYPFEEYQDNDKIANIAHFVGKKTSDFSYEGNIIHIMKSLIAWEEPRNTLPNVPYPVAEIYSKAQLINEKLAYKGQYVDRTETLFFDLNANNELIFRKCDCDGSGRPSVAAMWGNCFATINLMTKNVKSQIQELFQVKLPQLMNLARQNEEVECYPAAENILIKALKMSRPETGSVGSRQIEYDIATQLAKVYVKQGKLDEVEKLMMQSIPDIYPDKRGMIKCEMEKLRGKVGNDNV